ncbi:hypothetical protein LTR84_008271 [Exophiala bonariae]|uniref:Major facilitator superfamily (MFS) profile domain-containing protein n=1 Tax=Exophiala bonariae TaxID=1690606 RepID=A0AAV9N1D7_9EURO|nr:hypothetical protein LTR84_008271 [Exophiala bonariae]
MVTKANSDRIEDSGAIEQGEHDHVPQKNTDIYHGDAEIVVDIGSNAAKSEVASNLKLASDSHTILIPQPSDDPHDPLNWSHAKKHLLLATIGLAAFVADFQAGAAVPCIIIQGAEWHLSPTHVNYANNLNVLLVLMNLMWAVGINQTSSILFSLPVTEGGYGFSQSVVGYIFFAPVTGVVLGELFGHFFNDFLASRHIRRHKGIFIPEARLFPIYLSTIFMVPGLVLVGQSLFHHLHWAAIIMGWGMFVFGYMVATVAVTAYALDSYPTAAGEVSALINLARLLGGFSVGYFQLQWGEKSGYNVTFGVQAAIVAAGIMIIPLLHIFALEFPDG